MRLVKQIILTVIFSGFSGAWTDTLSNFLVKHGPKSLERSFYGTYLGDISPLEYKPLENNGNQSYQFWANHDMGQGWVEWETVSSSGVFNKNGDLTVKGKDKNRFLSSNGILNRLVDENSVFLSRWFGSRFYCPGKIYYFDLNGNLTNKSYGENGNAFSRYSYDDQGRITNYVQMLSNGTVWGRKTDVFWGESNVNHFRIWVIGFNGTSTPLTNYCKKFIYSNGIPATAVLSRNGIEASNHFFFRYTKVGSDFTYSNSGQSGYTSYNFNNEGQLTGRENYSVHKNSARRIINKTSLKIEYGQAGNYPTVAIIDIFRDKIRINKLEFRFDAKGRLMHELHYSFPNKTYQMISTRIICESSFSK
jgi:hypothetical protein